MTSPALAAAHRQLLAGDARAALDSCQRLLQQHPHDADVFNLTGLALAAQGALHTAARLYRQALVLDPNFVEAHSNLGSVLAGMGRPAEALAAFEQAIRLRPRDRAAWDNLLLCALCAPGLPPEAVAALHRDWGRLHADGITPLLPVPRPPLDGRRLRLGYVSADFRQSAVAWFLEPLLRHHDRGRVMVHGYANLAGEGDAVTARLRAAVEVWRPIGGRNDDDVARQIADDGIDVLVDLAGHTAGHRLGVFARRPAPVQVSYLGYPATTGLPAIGYRLTDAVADPPGASEALHSERLIRLEGGFLCYAGPATPAPAPVPPCRQRGHVTFGSFNDAAKVSASVLALWGTLLHRVPGARLLLKGKAYADPEVQRATAKVLAGAGVTADRLTFAGWQRDPDAHLRCYAEVDVALDPFPYNGTTTTCEALWMGVPVVALRGAAHVARMGASLLARVGLPDLVADSEPHYIALCAALAADPARLHALRAGLRAQLCASPLGDAAGQARAVEDCYFDCYFACHPQLTSRA